MEGQPPSLQFEEIYLEDDGPPMGDEPGVEETVEVMPKEASPIPPKEASPIPPKEASPIPPKETSPIPPKETSPIPPKETHSGSGVRGETPPAVDQSTASVRQSAAGAIRVHPTRKELLDETTGRQSHVNRKMPVKRRSRMKRIKPPDLIFPPHEYALPGAMHILFSLTDLLGDAGIYGEETIDSDLLQRHPAVLNFLERKLNTTKKRHSLLALKQVFTSDNDTIWNVIGLWIYLRDVEKLGPSGVPDLYPQVGSHTYAKENEASVLTLAARLERLEGMK